MWGSTGSRGILVEALGQKCKGRKGLEPRRACRLERDRPVAALHLQNVAAVVQRARVNATHRGQPAVQLRLYREAEDLNALGLGLGLGL
eukprot:scaffold96399_cov63-Phaeocystis_antarctica.AAC.1